MTKSISLYFDGGIRNGKIAVGYVALDPNNNENIIFQGYKKAGTGTSNIAEYRALISGLIHAIKEKVEVIHIYGDSQLVIKQINGSFQTKDKELGEHKNKTMELLENFKEWSIRWIPRKQNAYADHLVNLCFGVKNKNGKKI